MLEDIYKEMMLQNQKKEMTIHDVLKKHTPELVKEIEKAYMEARKEYSAWCKFVGKNEMHWWLDDNNTYRYLYYLMHFAYKEGWKDCNASTSD